MRRFSLLLLGAAACAAPAPQTTPSPAVLPGATAITAADLRRDLYVFAADSFRGREAGTADATRAASWLAGHLAALGLAPAGDSGYFQRVPMVREYVDPAASHVRVTRGGAVTELALGGDIAPLLSLGQGMYAKRAAEGDVVFVSYGLAMNGRDDFKGLDLAGKVVVFVNGAPAGMDSTMRKQLEGFDAIGLRIGGILARRPAAIVALLTGAGADLYDKASPELLKSVALASDASPEGEAQRQVPLILLAPLSRAGALVPANFPAVDSSRALAGVRLSADIRQVRSTFNGQNVVAILRGRDAAMANSYVALGAHLDHIGIQAPVAGDSIANGADDDGSGSIGLLAIARSMAAMPVKPRRSTLFVWHTGEEKGLLGSSYFVEHPTVPIDSIVAQVNADMIGRNGAVSETATPAPDVANAFYIVGPLAAPNNQSKVLGALVDSVNAASARPFRIDHEWDTPTHPERIYFRSDHYNYAKKGIPIVFLTTGLHPDYHRVSDSPDKIEYEKMARIATLMRDVVTTVGDRATRPR